MDRARAGSRRPSRGGPRPRDGEDVGRRRRATARGHEQDARRLADGSRGSGVTRSPRPSTRAAPPARKNGTSEPSRAATASRSSDRSSAPQASSARVEGRRGVAAAAGQPGRDGDPLLEPGGERPAAAGRARPSRRRPPRRVAAIARSTRFARAGPRPSSPSTWSVSATRRRRARRSAGRRAPSGTITEWSSWKPSGRRPTTASVRLSLAGASRHRAGRRGRLGADRASALMRSPAPAGRAVRPRSGPSAASRRSHSPTASVCGRRSAAIPAAAERGARPARLERAAAGRGRCGASSVARGTPPGRAARARPPSSGGSAAGRPAVRLDAR